MDMLNTRCPNLTCNREMEQQKPGSKEQAFCGTWWRCPRCHSAVLLPSPELTAQLADQRAKAARSAARRDPLVRAGFDAWISGEAYLDGRGGYRLKSDKRRLAPWSKAVTALYPNVSDFHEAAHAAQQRLERSTERHESVITPSEPPSIEGLLERREADVREGRLWTE